MTDPGFSKDDPHETTNILPVATKYFPRRIDIFPKRMVSDLLKKREIGSRFGSKISGLSSQVSSDIVKGVFGIYTGFIPVLDMTNCIQVSSKIIN